MKKEKILFVDDDPNILSAYKRKFYKKYDIHFAESGSDAIELVKANNNFMVIVSDYQMPGMNGVNFLSTARNISPNSIRILATGLADMGIAIDAINQGSIFRFLQKPFDDSVMEKALADALRQYKLETIEKSDRLKNEFLSTLSHEIRTPLNSITNFVQILEAELYDHMSDDLKSFSKVIKSNSERLIRTIHLMLDLSSIYSSNYDMQFSNVDLIQQILEPIVDKYQARARDKNLNLEFNSDVEQYKLSIDEYSVNQIISNLLDNAIKFTETGSVSINIKTNNGTIECEFADTGIGISEVFLPKMYDPFLQEMSGYTRLFEGNGLGLTLVKEFCELNNYVLDVESKKENGTTFTLKLNKNTLN